MNDRILIQNHTYHNRALYYSPDTGSCREVERNDVPLGTENWRGFYVNVGDRVYGYYASSAGPVFFADQERFRLADPACTAAVVAGSDENLFQLRHETKTRVEVRYSPPRFKDYDNWSDDTMVDFFVWVADALSDSRRARFTEFNTLEAGPAAGS